MFFGRVLGWALLGLALLMASGDAVLALGPGDHAAGIATAEVWMLLAGTAPQSDLLPSLGAALMAWPAWAVIAPLGLALTWACRPRRRRHFYRIHRFA